VVSYIDQLLKPPNQTVATPNTAAAAHVSFTAETDRIYLNAPNAMAVHDGAASAAADQKTSARVIKMTKTGFADAVVWNPWINKSKTMSDFGRCQQMCFASHFCAARAPPHSILWCLLV
jgi:D-hexose-6-phosphate mutarotase